MSGTAALPPIPQDQVWTERRPLMEQLIRRAFDRPIKAIEIGCWFGVGSTQIWLNNLKQGSTLLLIDSWKPYSSPKDLADKEWDYKEMDNLSTDAFLSTFLQVRKFETERRDSRLDMQLIRGDASTLLPLFAENSFDFIYIDGDHKYAKVKQDIQQAKRLVKKDYGIICGDDLERLPTPELVEVAKNHKTDDFLRDPYYFHPGVMVAVSEEFPVVNMANGFWWIVCKGGKFRTDLFPTLSA